IIFISHKLDEVLATSQRVAVLRQGKLVAIRDTLATNRTELAELMVGYRVEPPTRSASRHDFAPNPLLSVRKLTIGAQLEYADFDVLPCEIFGIAGVSGNGQAQLADALCGVVAPSHGEIRIGGRPIIAKPRAFVQTGVARVPEDRGAVGIIGELTIWEN